MNKELYVSSTPHETKVALVEDDQLAEIYFEREQEYTLAGSIYKGRVTRVLPGMQSAFVDIGLERDAFLYVSDFLDLQDEDDEFGDVPVGPAQMVEIKQDNRQQEPRQAAQATVPAPAEIGDDMGDEGDETEEASAGGNGEDAGAEPTDEAGARRWRGRRRRRGRRGGRERERLPEQQRSANAAELPTENVDEADEIEVPEAQAADEPAEIITSPTVEEEIPYEPMLLPGESIARYKRGADQPPRTFEAVDTAAHEERPAREERGGRRDRNDRNDRGERGRGGRLGRDRGDRGDRAPRESREPREAAEALPANYEPIVLPGESISKYKNQPQQTTTSFASESQVSESQVYPVIETASPVAETREETRKHDFSSVEPIASDGMIEQSSIQDVGLGETAAAVPTVVHAEPVQESTWNAPAYQPVPVEEVHTAPVVEEETVESAVLDNSTPVVEPTTEIAEPHNAWPVASPVAQVPAAEEKRVANMNVAAVFGGGETMENDEQTDELSESVLADHDSTPVHESRYAPQGGIVVHEELDEEEADAPLLAEDHDGYLMSEFEEETTDSGSTFEEGLPGAIAEALRDAEEDDDFEMAANGDEFEESEMLAGEEGDEFYEDGEEGDGEEAGEEEGEESNGRAELRAPAATAGMQQRAERPAFDRKSRDRNDRGRRGGRRGSPRPSGGGGRREMPSRPVPLISDLLKEGQEVLIQIAKEPINKKGARITSHIALPGRFLVFMPTVNHIGVSRKINSEEERQRLKRIVASERENGHGGFIVRTAAANVKEDELRADIRFLKHLWNEIKNRADSSKSPALIYHDLNLVERILRDQVTQDFSQIWVDNEQEYERIVRFASRFQPGLLRRIKLYSKTTPLFEQFGIQEEINKSLKAKVWLKSGGYIVINQTEALVAIDINTGKYVGKTTRLEDTIVKTNVDAIKEIVRQVRLRDLGGIIVIDFIDMDERKNRQKVMMALEEALKSDRAPSKVLQFNDFGLVAITRKRVKQSLERTLGTPCPYCESTGFVKSVTTVCNEIYVEMRKVAKQLDEKNVLLRVHPEVAKELKGANGKWLQEMEDLIGKTILLKPDVSLHQEQFDITG